MCFSLFKSFQRAIKKDKDGKASQVLVLVPFWTQGTLFLSGKQAGIHTSKSYKLLHS